MKKIVPMNENDFANLLCTMKEGQTIEFARDAYLWQEGLEIEIEPHEVECWYFARIFRVSEYQSRFILIDYCGGEDAFVIPLNCYSDVIDEDDERIIRIKVEQLFDHHLFIGPQGYVFVEMEEEE
jgi:hypothetical protein